MAALGTLLFLLQLVLGLASLACFIMVIIKMFQNDATGVAIASLVLLLCGIGVFVAFIYGWMKSGAWNITNVMLIWTGCILGGLVITLINMFVVVAAGVDAGGPINIEPNF